MNVNDESERQLRAAMDRLLSGTPIRSSGSMTVSALAAEAGVSRRTAGRAKGVLHDFQSALERRHISSPAGQEPENRQAELSSMRAKLREKNTEVARLRAELTRLACRVALLSEENEQLRRNAGGGRVIRLPGGSGR
jgi:chromosome segregation ATPase